MAMRLEARWIIAAWLVSVLSNRVAIRLNRLSLQMKRGIAEHGVEAHLGKAHPTPRPSVAYREIINGFRQNGAPLSKQT
jgi:hypothetical protein